MEAYYPLQAVGDSQASDSNAKQPMDVENLPSSSSFQWNMQYSQEKLYPKKL